MGMAGSCCEWICVPGLSVFGCEVTTASTATPHQCGRLPARNLVMSEPRMTRTSQRLDPSWIVTDSIENGQYDRCVDVFRRPDGSFGFEEFRRDAEDRGSWTPVAYYCPLRFATQAAALAAAARAVRWLCEQGQAAR